ncbi:hypothetical protein LEMLEM_LOCUS19893, partial [Lemmus lemmus]
MISSPNNNQRSYFCLCHESTEHPSSRNGKMAQQLRALAVLPEDPGSYSRSQHLYFGSQASVTPVPGDLMPSSDLCRHCIYVVYRHTMW